MKRVDSSHPYETIRKLCPEVLRGVLCSEAAHITLSELFASLLSKACHCGKHGGFLSLVTCARVCFECLQHADNGRLLTRGDLSFALDEDEIASLDELPCIRVIPGTYGVALSWRHSTAFPPQVLVELESRFHVWSTSDLSHVEETYLPPLTVFTRSFMAVVEAPWIDFENKVARAQHGRYCNACVKSTMVGNELDAGFTFHQYSQEEFLDHWREVHSSENSENN
jgi:hypothetical protein